MRLLLDLVAFFQSEGVWECVHPNGHRKEKDYTISLINPLVGFNKLLKPHEP